MVTLRHVELSKLLWGSENFAGHFEYLASGQARRICR